MPNFIQTEYVMFTFFPLKKSVHFRTVSVHFRTLFIFLPWGQNGQVVNLLQRCVFLFL